MQLELEGILYEAKKSPYNPDNVFYEMVKSKEGNLALFVDGEELGLLPDDSRESFLEYVVRNHRRVELYRLRSVLSDQEIIEFVNSIYQNGRERGME